jgi:hypothetical protein
MFFFVACSLVAVSAQAGKDIRKVKPAPMAVDDGIERQPQSTQAGAYIPGLDKPTNLNWFPVDSMANAFGPANNCTPLVYDPATNVLALLHRGAAPYAAGSGQLWYNISRNAGVTWRRVGELNGGAPQDCRYPSGAISNPANSSDTSQCLFVYVAPNLQSAGTWGYYTYGVDYPLGGGAGSGIADLNQLGASSSNGTIFGAYNSSWINWMATQAGTGLLNHSFLWRTNDYVTVSASFPNVWRDSTPVFVNAIAIINSMGTPSGSYYAMQGLWEGDTTGVDYFPFNGGYSKSTNAGATWGANWVRPQPDWVLATGIRRGWDLYDFAQPPGTTVSWNSTFTVDANGYGHFFHVVVDSPWTEREPRGILEVYQTTGGWAYKWVKQELNTYTGLGYPGVAVGNEYLNQTHVAPKASVSPDGQVMTLVWLDAATFAPADSFPDIWFSYRRITDNAWSTPLNLTQTPGFPELLLHAAPILKSNGVNSYTLFLGRSYQCNINTYPPDNGSKTTFYVAPYLFTTTDVNETGQQPVDFKLEQNYPNPFNPSTTIRYSVAEASRVSLKVFNTLGQEVATLVDENVSPGEHKATFDAGKLSSGVYLYKLSAGSRIESRKMVLVK